LAKNGLLELNGGWRFARPPWANAAHFSNLVAHALVKGVLSMVLKKGKIYQ
jgi:hypothetical protein